MVAATTLVLGACVLGACVLGACGVSEHRDDGGSPPDGGPPAVDGGARMVEDPRIPWETEGAPPVAPPAPIAWPCPAGWRATEIEREVSVCEPFPGDTPERCAADEMIAPGEDACTVVGAPCPDDGWPAVSADVRALFVRPGAVGGDGSRELPFGSIDEALAAAEEGTWIALATGRHETVAIAPAVSITIAGACARGTVLAPRADVAASAAVMRATGAGVALAIRELSIEAGARTGIEADRGAAVDIHSVVIRGASTGVYVHDGAAATMRSTRVTGTVVAAPAIGHGVRATYASVIDLQRVLVDHAAGAGVIAYDPGSTMRLDDVAVWDSGRNGVIAGDRTSADLHRTVVERARQVGVLLGGSVATVEDIVVRAVVEAGAIYAGRDGEPLTIRRAWVEEVAETAVSAAGEPLELEDVVVHRVAAGLIGALGLRVDGVLRRVAVLDVAGSGVRGSGTFEDVRIARVEPAGDGEVSFGLKQTGDELTLRRARLEAVAGIAFFLEGVEPGAIGTGGHAAIEDLSVDGATLGVGAFGAVTVEVDRARIARTTDGALGVTFGSMRATDVLVEDAIGTGAVPTFGIGALASEGARLTLERVWVRRQRAGGLLASGDGTTVVASDVIVEAGLGDLDGAFGRGIDVVSGAHGSLARARVDGVREVAVVAMGPGSAIEASDLRVIGTRERTCAETDPGSDCASAAGGTAIGSYSGASVVLRSFELDRAALCGLQIAGAASVDATAGLIRGCSIGICLQVDGFDVERVTRDVVLQGNARNVDSVDLPIPPSPSVPRVQP